MLFHENEVPRVEALARLSYGNPFLPDRIACEREVLGDRFQKTGLAWHRTADEEADRPNIALLTAWSRERLEAAQARLAEGAVPGDVEWPLYENLVHYFLYNKYEPELRRYMAACHEDRTPAKVAFYEPFARDLKRYLAPCTSAPPGKKETAHIFACFFQIRRAFRHIFDHIIGGSMASARLRADVWQSIFTCDMARYRRGLFARMGDITTLITGPSGTGKELVARAIGLSRYVPFDPKALRFTEDFSRGFHPINLTAIAPTLIEAELFGHVKGAFTGAIEERAGLFEACPAHGTVFLDELGELEPSLQVKLLRVLQNRTFQRVGETRARCFEGKIVAATNRDMALQMRERRFREDLYYRLCADVIVTPSLREQLAGAPEQLHNLVLFTARRVAGAEEAAALTEEVETYIHDHLGDDYPWPGNVRELEQCVRSILVHRSYHPAWRDQNAGVAAWLDAMRTGSLGADEALDAYITHVYAQTGSYLAAAGRLGLDRRTVKARINKTLLRQYGKGSAHDADKE